MHIPPGIDSYISKPFWQTDMAQAFVNVVKPYSENIIAVLASHTHMEELQMMAIDNKHVIPVIYSAGFSTSHANLPTFKNLSLHFSHHKWVLKNYQTYSYLNDRFSLYYDFQNTYCDGLRLPSVTACLETYYQENKLLDLLAVMNAHFTGGNPNSTARSRDANPDDLVIK